EILVSLRTAVQVRLPENVGAGLGIPLERQVLFLAVAQTARAAPSRPVGAPRLQRQAPKPDEKRCRGPIPSVIPSLRHHEDFLQSESNCSVPYVLKVHRCR